MKLEIQNTDGQYIFYEDCFYYSIGEHGELDIYKEGVVIATFSASSWSSVVRTKSPEEKWPEELEPKDGFSVNSSQMLEDFEFLQ